MILARISVWMSIFHLILFTSKFMLISFHLFIHRVFSRLFLCYIVFLLNYASPVIQSLMKSFQHCYLKKYSNIWWPGFKKKSIRMKTTISFVNQERIWFNGYHFFKFASFTVGQITVRGKIAAQHFSSLSSWIDSKVNPQSSKIYSKAT